MFGFQPTDYINWANGLKKAGYATDPNYPTKLIGLIIKYDLAKYDTKAILKKKIKLITTILIIVGLLVAYYYFLFRKTK